MIRKLANSQQVNASKFSFKLNRKYLKKENITDIVIYGFSKLEQTKK